MTAAGAAMIVPAWVHSLRSPASLLSPQIQSASPLARAAAALKNAFLSPLHRLATSPVARRAIELFSPKAALPPIPSASPSAALLLGRGNGGFQDAREAFGGVGAGDQTSRQQQPASNLDVREQEALFVSPVAAKSAQKGSLLKKAAEGGGGGGGGANSKKMKKGLLPPIAGATVSSVAKKGAGGRI